MKQILFLFACLVMSLQGLMGQSTISAGRAIEIQIKGVPSDEMARVNGTYTVSEGGSIRMPLLDGSIRAAGLSPTALAQSIEAAYRAAKIYTTPTINVIATNQEALEELTVTVGGQVQSPGPVRYFRGLTLYDAVQAAKGATPFGSMKRVRLIRGKQSKEYNLTDAKHMNTPLEPRDTIQVPQKDFLGN
ncbi:polysaccharide biosynthesis/export family protein [Luteolibacter marinus]|uniref:polysaccharide biosynthesis/export family protein n=1 Tax=Luteolibacter marinus TaxID=2776705 RepID=UPI0018672358|nr:polysaccharide biosynthesis/export family protein [Luteolibacter marinus]